VKPPHLAWGWRRVAEPAPPRALVAWGEVAPRLQRRLAALTAVAQARLHATAAGGLLVVGGDPDALPWVDGAAYAAPCAEAPGLWLPTLWEPDVPHELLARALARRHTRTPLLLWHAPAALVPLDRLLPLAPTLLARIDHRWRGPAATP
jgi:hypothetical protein